MTSVGKWRRLSTLATDEGHFAILAADHRDSLRMFLAPDAPESITDQDLIDTKLDLIRLIGSRASGVMLEPEFSIGPALASGALPRDVGFTAALEAQGYLADSSPTSLLDGWSVEAAAASGASAAKLLVMWNPGDSAACAAQEQVIQAVVAECARLDLPLFLEPILVAGDTQDMIEMIGHMATLGPDVLKLGFGAEWEHQVSTIAAATTGLPWAFLSGGVPFETYTDQLKMACEAGASGFMVGRALWGEFVKGTGGAEQVVERFDQLNSLVLDHGTPWTAKTAPPNVESNWYRR